MKKNLFLTGEIGIGKSTIIKKVIETHFSGSEIGGFKTTPYLERGNLIGYCISGYIEEAQDDGDSIVGVNLGEGEAKKCQGVSRVFETLGVDILDSSMKKQSDLIVLDELGFFESEAENFKRNVHSILDGGARVLGVLKKRDTPFLNSVKDRDDVLVLEVKTENRDSLLGEIESYWRL